jgi:two-component system, chemotaxis family, protein-glutamate methylesterase/glutaminase
MSKIRVLVIEDSLTTRQRLIEILRGDPDFEVVAEAEDGKRGIELARELKPDVITLDMVMPSMSGLAATEYIMAYFPTPIVIVSASTNRGDLFRTWEALGAGAVEVLEKPRGDASDEEWERNFLFTVKVASRVKVITHLRLRVAGRTRAAAALASGAASRPPASGDVVSGGRAQLLAIGASTGGPGALVELLHAFDGRLRLPVLLVIHIGEMFGPSFADWLDGQSSSVRVRYAVDGEPLPPPGVGQILMAPPNRHLVLQQGRLKLTQDRERHSCRPSIDVLFESLAQPLGERVAACLLTGMGKDGAEGLLAIRRAGGTTFAQDEATSVVFGMPREAAAIGAAMQVLALEQIGPALLQASAGVRSRS